MAVSKREKRSGQLVDHQQVAEFAEIIRNGYWWDRPLEIIEKLLRNEMLMKEIKDRQFSNEGDKLLFDKASEACEEAEREWRWVPEEEKQKITSHSTELRNELRNRYRALAATLPQAEKIQERERVSYLINKLLWMVDL